MTQTSAQDLDLSHLSDKLLNAARKFADLKYQVDVTGRRCPSDTPNDLHGRMSSGEYDGPYGGESFLNSIIPFMPFPYHEDNLGVKFVPISHTLGRSWRWWPEHCKGDEEYIRNKILSVEYGKDAYYYFIKELGVIFASEGKNRVYFCRHHGIEKIPVTVIQQNYPPAESITIHYTSGPFGTEVFAVLDSRYLQKMNHISYALPLLNAYGVNVSTNWPSELPSILSIYKYASSCKADATFALRTIDLDKVRVRLLERSTYVEKNDNLIDLFVKKLFKLR